MSSPNFSTPSHFGLKILFHDIGEVGGDDEIINYFSKEISINTIYLFWNINRILMPYILKLGIPGKLDLVRIVLPAREGSNFPSS